MAYFLFSRHSTPFLNKVMNARYCENNSQGLPQTPRLGAGPVGPSVISSFICFLLGWLLGTLNTLLVQFPLCPGCLCSLEQLKCPLQPLHGQAGNLKGRALPKFAHPFYFLGGSLSSIFSSVNPKFSKAFTVRMGFA